MTSKNRSYRFGVCGLPLAVEFGKHFDVVGFDSIWIGSNLMERCTGELTESEIFEVKHSLHNDTILADRNIFIVTVPTPVDSNNQPDFGFSNTQATVGKFLSKLVW